MPRALLQQVGRAIVLVQPTGVIEPAAWTAIVAQMRAWSIGPAEVFTLVWTDGQLDSGQRREIIDMIKSLPPLSNGQQPKTRAVLFTSSLLSRGVMRALAWMGADVSSFAKTELFAGLRAEGFDAAEVADIHAAIVALEAEILPGLNDKDRSQALKNPLATSLSMTSPKSSSSSSSSSSASPPR